MTGKELHAHVSYLLIICNSIIFYSKIKEIVEVTVVVGVDISILEILET